MKKHIICLYFLLIITLNNAIGQSLEQILEKHYQASGTSNFKNVQSLRYNATRINHFLYHLTQNSAELTSIQIILVTRDNEYLYQNFSHWGEDAYSYANGSYWRDTPSPEPPQKFSPGRFDALLIRFYLDFEGFLFNWGKKEYRVFKLDDVRLSQKNYHLLKLITSQKDTLFYYINRSNYLIDKISFNGDLADGKEHFSVTFSEYKELNGIQIPYKRLWRTSSMSGRWGDYEIKIDSIDFNPNFDKKIFTLGKKN